MKNEKIEEIQILRGLAILGVITIHVTKQKNGLLDPLSYVYIITTFLNLFSLTFSVPLFILISGVVLGLKYKGDFSLSNFYRKRAVKIISPYIIFSLIYILYSKISNECNITGITGPLWVDTVYRLFTARACTHFWFFGLIIQLYIFYPLIIKATAHIDSKNNWLKFLIAIFLIQIIWNNINYKLAYLIIEPTGLINNIINSYISGLFFSHLIYFVLGIYISNNIDTVRVKLRKLKMCNIIFIILLYTVILLSIVIYKRSYGLNKLLYSWDFRILTILEPIIGIYIFILFYKLSTRLTELKLRIKNVLTFIGNYSYGIYLIHLIILIEAVNIFSNIFGFNYNLKFYLLNFIATVCLSVISLKLMTFLPFSEFIIGVKSRNSVKNDPS